MFHKDTVIFFSSFFFFYFYVFNEWEMLKEGTANPHGFLIDRFGEVKLKETPPKAG